ncbi:uncharacterized protein LOC128951267 [Oppia nitens]|uniref:uncharacterized protein LOC128951267 n=1 Tax=Oppia nitens TaxID=1686743 RepID=UPI0023DC6D12|nr:uncharacterized protein LOC128951267 [Oppia nitens]
MSSQTTINVLLLGETGIGKSTFINALANYIQYDTLDAAKSGEPLCLIATQFKVSDADYNLIDVSYGCDPNECYEHEGQTVTQQCREYTIDYDNQSIRLIDTPGIGDTRGVDRDQENFEHILEFIEQYDVLHSICILLKPDMTRLTASFEYCIRQLLALLPSDAGAHVVFLFTNSRSTCYRPKNTMVLLKELLNELKQEPTGGVDIPTGRDNMYCVDNDSFNFLLALRNGIKFSDKEVADYGHGWKMSGTECRNWLRYLSDGMANNRQLDVKRLKQKRQTNIIEKIMIDLMGEIEKIDQLILDNTHKTIIIKSKSMTDLKYREDNSLVKFDDLDENVSCSFRKLFRSMFKVKKSSSNKNNNNKTSSSSSSKAKVSNQKHNDHQKHYDNDASSDEPQLKQIDHDNLELETEYAQLVDCLVKLCWFVVGNNNNNFVNPYDEYIGQCIDQHSSTNLIDNDDNDDDDDYDNDLVKFYKIRSDQYNQLVQQRDDNSASKLTMQANCDMIKQLCQLKISGKNIEKICVLEK